MADTAKEWGVDRNDLVVEKKAADTKDHVIYVKEIVGKDPFILVTVRIPYAARHGAFQEVWDGTDTGADGLHGEGAGRWVDAGSFLSWYRFAGKRWKGRFMSIWGWFGRGLNGQV